jgi:hypothetical protein
VASDLPDDSAAPPPSPTGRGWLGRLWRRRDTTPAPVGDGTAPAPRRGRLRLAVYLVAGLVAVFLIYLVAASAIVSKIDDDGAFVAPQPTPGGSMAVDMAAALIDREVDANGWTANDPFFMPGALLDNMPNYQQGMIYALSRFATELGDQLGRTRGTSQIDPDLDRAAGLLRYPGTVWIFDLDTSWAPTASSESQYRSAAESLRKFNGRVADGTAPFERRTDNLIRTLERISSDLGSRSAVTAAHIEKSGGWLDFQADDIFYDTKGRLYTYYMMLNALGQDFAGVIRQAGADAVWAQMLDSLRDAVALQPLMISNGAPDSQMLPNHLAAQGFYLLRARTQINEVVNILQN